MSEYKNIIVEQRDQSEWVTLNRPEQLNALNREMILELIDYFHGLKRRHDVRVVVLKANGRAFCAGVDLGDSSIHSECIPEVFGFQQDIASIMQLIATCPQPVITLLNGPVCGGGFTMALASDIRLAAPDTRMNAAFIKMGWTGCDMGSSYFLPRLVGTAVASELLMTGRFIHADRALRVNLVNEVVEREELEKAAQVYIDEMMLTSPMGLRLTKQALHYSVDAQSMGAAMAMEDRHQMLLSQTEDHKEAVAAFFEKRAPVYKDR